MDFTGKTVVITGASRGIGRATAIGFAKYGANVVVAYLSNKEKATEVVDLINKENGNAAIFQCDVRDFEKVKSLMKFTVGKYGKIDVLVNNAGVVQNSFITHTSEEQWDFIVDTNLKGVFLCTKAVARIMMKQKSGKIINISSIGGLRSNIMQASYSASKAGVIAFTKSTAMELSPSGIQVNAVAPGGTNTDMYHNANELLIRKEKQRNLFGKIMEPEDVAEIIVFLASDKANYITGEVITIDGGTILAN